jgi:beta-lactamase class A
VLPRRTRFFTFFSLALVCLVLAGSLAAAQAARYAATRALLPPGTQIAGVPVGGLSRPEAGARLAQAYALTPVELQIRDSRVQVDPVPAGLELDLAGMFGEVDRALAARPYWEGFWDFLWDRPPDPVESGLLCSVDETRLHETVSALLAGRYDQAPTPAAPVPGDVIFTPGRPGETLDIAAALPELSRAMCNRASRSVTLDSVSIPALPPTPAQLRLVLETLVQVSAFNGTVELYFEDLQTGDSFSLATSGGRAVKPGIAFTAASTIKIPVMVSAYKQVDGELPADLRQQMAAMIDLSDNASTDEVMQRVLDANLAPIQVTQDARALGLQDTFLAGFFYPGAPLLDLYQTPANQRGDVSTDPDVYNQTTAIDMGRLLSGIRQCAARGSGRLVEIFADQLTQAECQEMVDLLAENRKGVLIEAGLPEGTALAHKYGWVTDPLDGLMHQASDAALVFTPGGDFVLTVYLHQSDQLQWESAQRLVARLATAIFNYFNQWR